MGILSKLKKSITKFANKVWDNKILRGVIIAAAIAYAAPAVSSWMSAGAGPATTAAGTEAAAMYGVEGVTELGLAGQGTSAAAPSLGLQGAAAETAATTAATAPVSTGIIEGATTAATEQGLAATSLTPQAVAQPAAGANILTAPTGVAPTGISPGAQGVSTAHPSFMENAGTWAKENPTLAYGALQLGGGMLSAATSQTEAEIAAENRRNIRAESAAPNVRFQMLSQPVQRGQYYA